MVKRITRGKEKLDYGGESINPYEKRDEIKSTVPWGVKGIQKLKQNASLKRKEFKLIEGTYS